MRNNERRIGRPDRGPGFGRSRSGFLGPLLVLILAGWLLYKYGPDLLNSLPSLKSAINYGAIDHAIPRPTAWSGLPLLPGEKHEVRNFL